MSQRPFRFGVINETTPPADEWRRMVRRAEQLGYDILLIRDHLIPDVFGDQLGPIAALATAAAITERLRIGTLVLSNDYRHPALLAKECATLSALSGGRFELGIGAGWLRAEYQQAGLPFEGAGARIERLEESLRVLRGLWAPGAFSMAGRFYQIDQIEGTPRLTQPPPILLGGGKRSMLQLAGRAADIISMLTTSVASGAMQQDPEERMPASVLQKLDWVREGAGARFDQIELSLIPSVVITDDRRAAAERFIQERGWSGVSPEQIWEMPSVFIGTLEQIAADMWARRAAYGFSYYVVSDTQAEQFAPLVARLAGQ
jgi:probable F420-dependent oxidoreductase